MNTSAAQAAEMIAFVLATAGITFCKRRQHEYATSHIVKRGGLAMYSVLWSAHARHSLDYMKTSDEYLDNAHSEHVCDAADVVCVGSLKCPLIDPPHVIRIVLVQLLVRVHLIMQQQCEIWRYPQSPSQTNLVSIYMVTAAQSHTCGHSMMCA